MRLTLLAAVACLVVVTAEANRYDCLRNCLIGLPQGHRASEEKGCVATCLYGVAGAHAVSVTPTDYDAWTLRSKGAWSGREGVMGAVYHDFIYMAGGRGTWGVGFFNDVYRSVDGSQWESLVANGAAPWGKRAYHIMLEHNGLLVLMGGQNFGEFFNDVWTSSDGVTWTCVTKHAPWHIRAGLAAASFQGKLLVTGGSYQTSVISPRSFFSDVWVSVDGKAWNMLTESAGFIPCSGPRLAQLRGSLYLLGGENGFSEQTQFNHVWSTQDGANWHFVNNAPWSNRSGHGVVVHQNAMYVIAGYLNLHDLWKSDDGRQWTQVSSSIFNCQSAKCGRYDFWSLVKDDNIVVLGGSGAQSTFGPPLYDETWSLKLV